MNLETSQLCLHLQTPAEVLIWIESLQPEVKAEISPLWLKRLHLADGPDPWSCMFTILRKDDNVNIGSCAFKGPPDENGVVEIAYGIDEEHRGKGYASEAAEALVKYAREILGNVTVRAHTKLDNKASERVLIKSGFRYAGVYEHPEDGTVNRWDNQPGL